MNRLLTPLRAMLLLLTAAAVASCADDPRQGWSTASVYPTQYRTVAVNVFQNDTYFREVGFMLTDAVITTIERQTPYKVTSESNADTLLTGRITNVNLTSLSQNESTGLDEEVIVGVTIDFNWTDLETDRTIRSGRASRAAACSFRPPSPEKHSNSVKSESYSSWPAIWSMRCRRSGKV